MSQNRNDNSPEENEFREYLLQMGIASPVTKQNAGSRYHTELAAQLCDWLLNGPLNRHGGMMTLSEVYCHFNRARGTELISPEDLTRAVALLETLGLNVRLKIFPGRDVRVLFAFVGNNPDEALFKRLGELVESEGFVSAFDLAKRDQIAPSLAKEQLLAAEQAGVLCRDETFEGLVFYPNFFLAY